MPHVVGTELDFDAVLAAPVGLAVVTDVLRLAGALGQLGGGILGADAWAFMEAHPFGVITELIATVDDGTSDDPAEVEQAWAAELEARIARADADPDDAIDWADLRAELLAK